MYDEYFTILFVANPIPKLPAGHQFSTQADNTVCIIASNVEEAITAQVSLDELNIHQNARVKSKVNISLCRKQSYQRKYFEDIHSRFDQVKPVVSHLDFRLPEKPLYPNNIGENLKGHQRQLQK